MGFTDSDWAGRNADRKSVGGCIFFSACDKEGSPSGPILWQVKTQSVVALSTLEAEYIACSDATREALWLARLEADILATIEPGRTTQLVSIASDNQGALKLIHTGIVRQQTKHIAVKYQHSHDEERKGSVWFHYVHTSDNAADVLTKPLPTPGHQRLTHLIGIRQPTIEPK